jgi:hypothetical protein
MMSQLAAAQYFIPEMSSNGLISSPEVYAITMENDTLRGKIRSALLMSGQLKSFTIKKDDGTKVKFKSGEAKLLAVKPSKMANLESAMSVPNLRTLMKVDFDDVINREWVFYELAMLDKKKDKPRMMQLLNPGFDSKIKVYLDPNAKETKGGMLLGGGEDKSYLVLFDGDKVDTYKKKRYNKEAKNLLFKDCKVFMENYDGERFKWKNFAEHVFVYDQLCD